MESVSAQEAIPVVMKNMPHIIKSVTSTAFEQAMVNGEYSVYGRVVYKHLLNFNSSIVYACCLIILICCLVKSCRHNNNLSYLTMCALLSTVMLVSLVRIGLVLEVLHAMELIKPKDGNYGFPSPLNLYSLPVIAAEVLALLVIQYFLIAQNYRGRTIPAVMAKITCYIFAAFSVYLMFAGWQMSFPLTSRYDTRQFLTILFIFMAMMFLATLFLSVLVLIYAAITDADDDFEQVPDLGAPNMRYMSVASKIMGCM